MSLSGTTQFQPASAAGYPGATPQARLAGTSQLAVAPASTELSALEAGGGALQWGLVHLHPHLTYEVSYGNGVQAAPGQQANTLINQVSPGVLIQLGSHWTIDYTPTLSFYSDRRFQDRTDHAVALSGATTYQDWSFSVSQGYSVSSQPLVETAAQTSQEAYSTSLKAAYQLNTKASLSFGLNQNFRFVGQSIASEQLTDMREWSTMDWFNYAVTPRVSLGIGAGFTYDNLSVGPDTTSERSQGRFSLMAGKRITLSLSAGLDDRQFLNSQTSDLLSPTFSASIQYQLFEATTLRLTANRGVAPSYFQTQATTSTTVNAGLHQRLLSHFFLDLSGAYGTTAYNATSTTPVASGIGDYSSTSFNASLGTTFLKRVTASVFYQITYNSSGAAIYNYTTKQVGLMLGCRF